MGRQDSLLQKSVQGSTVSIHLNLVGLQIAYPLMHKSSALLQQITAHVCLLHCTTDRVRQGQLQGSMARRGTLSRPYPE